MSDEMYLLLVEYAENEAAKFQESCCHDFSDGWDDVYHVSEEDEEPETPEQIERRLAKVAKWRSMTPKEFWLMMHEW